MSIDLMSAWHKLNRATDHMAVFDGLLKDYEKPGPQRMTWSQDPPGVWTLTVTRADPMPVRLSQVAGDVVHNARAALDHAIWQLAGGKAHEQTGFPVVVERIKVRNGEEVDGWAAVAGNALRGLTDSQVAVVERFQPYQLRSLPDVDRLPHGHPLWPNLSVVLLHRLNNIDKHRALLGQFPIAWVPVRELIANASTSPEAAEYVFVRMVTGTFVHRADVRNMTEDPLFRRPHWNALIGELPEGEFWDSRVGTMSVTDLRTSLDHVRAILTALHAA
jgi:hypothetical protein